MSRRGNRAGIALPLLSLLLALLMIVFDFGRLGRLHRATARGILLFLVSWPFRLLLGDTSVWQTFASTLIGGL